MMTTSSGGLRKSRNRRKMKMRLVRKMWKRSCSSWSTQIRSKQSLLWLMSSIILLQRISLFMLNMMTFPLLTADLLMLLWRNLTNSSKSIFLAISSSKIHSSQVCSQEFSTWNREPNSSTLTKSWTTWLKPSWSRTNSTSLTTPDTWSPRKVISSWSAGSTQPQESSSTNHTTLMNIGLSWNLWTICSTLEPTT